MLDVVRLVLGFNSSETEKVTKLIMYYFRAF